MTSETETGSTASNISTGGSSWKVPAEVGVFLAIVMAVANIIPDIAPMIGENPAMAIVFVAMLFLVVFMASKDRIQGWFQNLGNRQIDYIAEWANYFDARMDRAAESRQKQVDSVLDVYEKVEQIDRKLDAAIEAIDRIEMEADR